MTALRRILSAPLLLVARALIAETTRSIDPKAVVSYVANSCDLGWVLADPRTRRGSGS
jgi:hypothetical protein